MQNDRMAAELFLIAKQFKGKNVDNIRVSDMAEECADRILELDEIISVYNKFTGCVVRKVAWFDNALELMANNPNEVKLYNTAFGYGKYIIYDKGVGYVYNDRLFVALTKDEAAKKLAPLATEKDKFYIIYNPNNLKPLKDERIFQGVIYGQ